MSNYSSEMMNIDLLIPADYNPRKDLQAGDEEFESLKRVIQQFGLVQPIVLNIRNNTIVGGHQRVKVAKELGYTEVPVVKVDLDEAEEKTLNLALNKVGGEFDEEKLASVLNSLRVDGADLDLTGFNDIEIEELLFAFEDTNLDVDMPDYGDTTGEPSEFDDEEGGFEGGEDSERGYTIQYNIVFDDEVQQETWHNFLRKLKDELDNDAFPTHASRLHAFLMKEVFNRG